MLLVQRRILLKKSGLLALLGSQSLVVKCTAAILFRTVDHVTYRKRLVLDQE